jgi:hypothetical protein
MTVFPWLVLILVLLLVAELIMITPGALRGMVAERRLRVVRPTIRTVMILTAVELVIVLAWGLFLRPR